MLTSVVALVLFIIIFVSLFHRYYITTNLHSPTKVEIGTMVLSALTYVLVVKVFLSYILTLIS